MLAKIYNCNELNEGELTTFRNYITGFSNQSLTEFNSQFSNIKLEPSLDHASQCQEVKQNCFDRFKPVIMALNTIKKAKILEIFKY